MQIYFYLQKKKKKINLFVKPVWVILKMQSTVKMLSMLKKKKLFFQGMLHKYSLE